MKIPVDLKIKYLNRRLDDVKKLRLNIDTNDYSFAIKIGHQIKGNAVTFEVPQIASIGSEIEKAALVRDREKLIILIQKMESLIFNVQKNVT